MKLLITGASGLYGSKLAQLATGKHHQVYSLDNQNPATFGVPIQADITNKPQIESIFKEINPEAVIHAATLTDVDKCEQNRELAWKINVDGTTNIAQAAKANNAFVLYISTDYVFDGDKGNYIETDLPSPINFYGYTKLKAEEQIKKILNEYCIARTSVIYGFNPGSRQNQLRPLANKQTKKQRTNQSIHRPMELPHSKHKSSPNDSGNNRSQNYPAFSISPVPHE